MSSDHKKLLELALYIAEKANGDSYLSLTKLNKILFLADFHYYLKTGKTITGQPYRKLPYGPVPKDMKKVEKATGDIAFRVADFFGHAQKKPVPLRHAELVEFSGDEISFVDSLIEMVCNKSKVSASWISEKSHEYIGWDMVSVGQLIPYNTIYFGRTQDQKATSFDRSYAKSLLSELGEGYGYRHAT